MPLFDLAVQEMTSQFVLFFSFLLIFLLWLLPSKTHSDSDSLLLLFLSLLGLLVSQVSQVRSAWLSPSWPLLWLVWLSDIWLLLSVFP